MKQPVQSVLRARYDNSDKRLVPGMFADLTLITDEKNNAIQVPTEAVVPDMNEKRVWILQERQSCTGPCYMQATAQRTWSKYSPGSVWVIL